MQLEFRELAEAPAQATAAVQGGPKQDRGRGCSGGALGCAGRFGRCSRVCRAFWTVFSGAQGVSNDRSRGQPRGPRAGHKPGATAQDTVAL